MAIVLCQCWIYEWARCYGITAQLDFSFGKVGLLNKTNQGYNYCLFQPVRRVTVLLSAGHR